MLVHPGEEFQVFWITDKSFHWIRFIRWWKWKVIIMEEIIRRFEDEIRLCIKTTSGIIRCANFWRVMGLRVGGDFVFSWDHVIRLPCSHTNTGLLFRKKSRAKIIMNMVMFWRNKRKRSLWKSSYFQKSWLSCLSFIEMTYLSFKNRDKENRSRWKIRSQGIRHFRDYFFNKILVSFESVEWRVYVGVFSC